MVCKKLNGLGKKKFKNSSRNHHGGIKKITKEVVQDGQSPPKTFLRPSGRNLTWDNFLKSLQNLTKVPSVSFFKNVPAHDLWEKIAIPGLVVELPNPFSERQNVFWVATLIHYAGYFALVEFETFGETPALLSWISFLSNVPRPIGWAEANRKILHPGKEIINAHPNYMEKLVEFLKDKKTISHDHVQNYKDSISSMIPFEVSSLPVEVVDFHSRKCQFKLARITAVCGDRIHVQYLDSDESESDGFWLKSKSDPIFPLGFCQAVGGIPISGLNSNSITFPTLPLDSFPEYPEEIKLKENMFMELRHPILPYKIVTGLILKVLRHGWFIVETCDLMLSDRCQFLFHITSPFIFPYGWGLQYEIEVENYYKDRMWDKEFLEFELLPIRQPHRFEVGMVLEACDLFDPTFFGPATIKGVCGHMLFIHFNNWSTNKENFAYVDAEYSCIYPIGYTELSGIQFQGHI